MLELLDIYEQVHWELVAVVGVIQVGWYGKYSKVDRILNHEIK